MTRSQDCIRCSEMKEVALHMIRDYVASKELWILIVPDKVRPNFFFSSLRDSMCASLSIRRRGPEVCGLPEKFVVACWYLWRWRNAETFKEEVLPLHQRLEMINTTVEETKRV